MHTTFLKPLGPGSMSASVCFKISLWLLSIIWCISSDVTGWLVLSFNTISSVSTWINSSTISLGHLLTSLNFQILVVTFHTHLTHWQCYVILPQFCILHLNKSSIWISMQWNRYERWKNIGSWGLNWLAKYYSRCKCGIWGDITIQKSNAHSRE